MQNPQQHVLLQKGYREILAGGMRTPVNDTVHIQVQMIKLGQEGIVGDNLIDLGITLRDPSVKLRGLSKSRGGE
jgi:hypothetical protein